MSGHLSTLVKALALIVAFAIGLLLQHILPTEWRNDPLVDNIIVGLPTLLTGLAILAYHEFDTIYFAVNRIWLTLTPGSTIRFQIDAELGLRRQIGWQVVENVFKDHFQEASPWAGAAGPILPLLNITLRTEQYQRVPEDPHTWSLELMSNEAELSFSALGKLITDLSAFFKSLDEAVNPIDEKYVFKVKFRGVNPYLGLFLRHSRVPRPLTFNVVFEEYVGGQREVVEILEDEVRVVARTRAGWERLSDKYARLKLDASDALLESLH